MKRNISYGRQNISDADIQAVIDVLKSDYLTQGPVVPAFENAIADYCKARFGVAANSATSALHIACLALGLGVGDLVWTTPITFVASSNCVLYCGGVVDFVDIDPLTYNIDVGLLEEKLVQAEKDNALPRIVVAVHLCGQPCDMAAIHALSRKYGFKIIEDASHAIGGKYLDEPIGNCRFSDITVFSFHPVKIITTGEGGLALTNDAELADTMRRYRSHGITSDKSQMKSRPDGEIWNYQQVRLGFNYRMTDIQAALGLSQMKRLDEFITRRHVIASRYDERLSDLPLRLPWQHPQGFSSYHLYPVRLDPLKTARTQRQVYDALQDSEINVNLHYIPVYRQPYYEEMGFRQGYCPEAERYFVEALSIPIYPALSDDEQEYVIRILHEVLT